jgi:hypothetical protein
MINPSNGNNLMRNDMYKVIVERPRRGGCTTYGWRQLHDIEESPRQEGLRKRHQNRKWLNENLRPLERFLASQTGRPWSKVYAEICEHIDRRNTVQQHIHEHLSGFVAMKVVALDGVLCYERHWSGLEPLERYWAPALYVDPVTGLLRANRLREKARRHYRENHLRKANPALPHRRDLDATHQLHRINGIWYWVELASIEKAGSGKSPAYDVLRRLEAEKCPKATNKKGIASNRTLFGRDDVYACKKRQLNARELREHDLNNGDGLDVRN